MSNSPVLGSTTRLQSSQERWAKAEQTTMRKLLSTCWQHLKAMLGLVPLSLLGTQGAIYILSAQSSN